MCQIFWHCQSFIWSQQPLIVCRWTCQTSDQRRQILAEGYRNLLGFSKFVSDDQIVAKIAQCEPGLNQRFWAKRLSEWFSNTLVATYWCNCEIYSKWLGKIHPYTDRNVLFVFYSYVYLYIFSCVMFHFFCTVHWADLSWFTFHYWLYSV